MLLFGTKKLIPVKYDGPYYANLFAHWLGFVRVRALGQTKVTLSPDITSWRSKGCEAEIHAFVISAQDACALGSHTDSFAPEQPVLVSNYIRQIWTGWLTENFMSVAGTGSNSSRLRRYIIVSSYSREFFLSFIILRTTSWETTQRFMDREERNKKTVSHLMW